MAYGERDLRQIGSKLEQGKLALFSTDSTVFGAHSALSRQGRKLLVFRGFVLSSRTPPQPLQVGRSRSNPHRWRDVIRNGAACRARVELGADGRDWPCLTRWLTTPSLSQEVRPGLSARQYLQCPCPISLLDLGISGVKSKGTSSLGTARCAVGPGRQNLNDALSVKPERCVVGSQHDLCKYDPSDVKPSQAD